MQLATQAEHCVATGKGNATGAARCTCMLAAGRSNSGSAACTPMPKAFHWVAAVAVRATATVAALRHARVVDCGVASDAGA